MDEEWQAWQKCQESYQSTLEKSTSKEGIKTLWVGEIEAWMDESFIQQMFLACGFCVQAKLIRDKTSGLPAGYGFAEFSSHEVAKNVLEVLAGKPIPILPGKKFRLNWASFANKISVTPSEGQGSVEETHSMFVGDLDQSVDDAVLTKAFSSYPTIRDVKVIYDPATGQSKGYGFVRFNSSTERDLAMNEMQGQILNGRCIKLNLAVAKKPASFSAIGQGASTATISLGEKNRGNSSTLMLLGLDDTLSYNVLFRKFSEFGSVLQLKIIEGKGNAFVQFENRASAEAAFSLDGTFLGQNRLLLTWCSQNLQTSSFPSSVNSSSLYPSSWGGGGEDYSLYYGGQGGVGAAGYYDPRQLAYLQQQQMLYFQHQMMYGTTPDDAAKAVGEALYAGVSEDGFVCLFCFKRFLFITMISPEHGIIHLVEFDSDKA